MSVIFSRAPLRISLGGGGTDLPSYYREPRRFPDPGAIDKYVYMLTHTVFQRRYRLKDAEFEEVDDRPRSGTRSCARRSCATGAASRWRSPRGRCARRDRDRLLGRVHRLPAEGVGARAPHDATAAAAGRGGLRDRDRHPREPSASRTSTSPHTAASAPTRSPGRGVDVDPLALGGDTLNRMSTTCSSTPARRAARRAAGRPEPAHARAGRRHART